MQNLDIRKSIEDNDFKYWQVASKLGMTDGSFSRLLRFELTEIDKEKVMKAIEELKEERKQWSQTKSYIPNKI